MCVKNDKCCYVIVNIFIFKNSVVVYSLFMIKYEVYFKLKRVYF